MDFIYFVHDSIFKTDFYLFVYFYQFTLPFELQRKKDEMKDKLIIKETNQEKQKQN